MFAIEFTRPQTRHHITLQNVDVRKKQQSEARILVNNNSGIKNYTLSHHTT